MGKMDGAKASLRVGGMRGFPHDCSSNAATGAMNSRELASAYADRQIAVCSGRLDFARVSSCSLVLCWFLLSYEQRLRQLEVHRLQLRGFALRGTRMG